MPDCVRREDQQPATLDVDVVLPQQITVPVGYLGVRDAMDLRTDAELRPIRIEIVPPVWSLEDPLTVRLRQVPCPTYQVELALRKGLDPSLGIPDRLDDDGPVTASPAAAQRIPERGSPEKSLLDRG